MIARAGKYLALAAACLLALAACQTADPPDPEIILRVRLHDSLKQYDRVVVQLIDRNDTNHVLTTLWNGALPNPASDIQGFSMKGQPSKSFIVKVEAYKALGQLALKTLIYYEPGLKTVRHDSVAPLRPLNWLETLAPSPGELKPKFHRDSLRYTVTLPPNVNALAFTVAGAIPGVSILVDGAAVASGTASKIHQIGSKGDTIPITVTDTSTGKASTRIYSVNVVPTLPPGLNLASLAPSVGALNREFDPAQTIYVVYMPQDVDTISFRAKPADTRTMTMIIDHEAVFWPAPSKVITVPKGATYTVGIEVNRGSEMAYYQVTLDHTQTDH